MQHGTKTGTLIISLDFELMWGMFDKVTAATYGENLNGVHEVLPYLLQHFADHGIHATWATVGMLMSANAGELQTHLPDRSEEPQYHTESLSAYAHWRSAAPTHVPKHYFGAPLVRAILQTKNQELASHTFSHYYCREAQRDVHAADAAFTADCEAFAQAVAPFGASIRSIVFPRNQWDDAALNTLASFGFTAFRGTETHFLYKARTDREQNNPYIRLIRLIDHYVNISGHHTYPLTNNLRHASGLINLPASRFLRPWSTRLRFLEPLRLRRIKKSMTVAAKRGEVFHLWWHPHNFGKNQVENVAFLTELLNHFTKLQNTYGMQSLSMGEAATRVRELP